MNPKHNILWHSLAWLLFGALCIFLNRYTNLDVTLSSLFFNAEIHQFPLKQNPWLTLILHTGMRWLAAAVWLGLLFSALRATLNRAHRLEIANLLIVSMLCAVAVSLLKAKSMHSCPWDLSIFGGSADYFRIFQNTNGIQNSGPGKCFPSGHASTAFMWITLLYSTLPTLRQHRVWVIFAILMTGALSGGVQMLKGAHFLSHVLTTAWVCWGVTLAWHVSVLFLKARKLRV